MKHKSALTETVEEYPEGAIATFEFLKVLALRVSPLLMGYLYLWNTYWLCQWWGLGWGIFAAVMGIVIFPVVPVICIAAPFIYWMVAGSPPLLHLGIWVVCFGPMIVAPKIGHALGLYE